MGKVTHFEIPSDDLERAKKFYGSVFGWEVNTWPMPNGGNYTGLTTVPVDKETMIPTEPGAINGGMTERSEVTPGPVITVEVESIDEALRDIEANGGSTTVPRTEIPGMGAFGYFKDSEGNIMGLWETTS